MKSPFARSARLELVTPEHVPLRFELADLGQRLAAVGLDLAIQLAAMFGLAVAIALVGLWHELSFAVFLVLLFLLRNFYFILSEVRWQGRTPGKRVMRVRVVAVDGGPLTTDMILARNLTREIETFLPLVALLGGGNLLPGYPWWARIATLLWVILLTLLPWFNHRRARLGDLLAGTLVVAEPRAELADDLLEEDRAAAALGELRFTREQLSIYGIEELQVLERVLRRAPSEERDALLADIAARVQKKIGWGEAHPSPPPLVFLRAFYGAQRGHLEAGMLLGRRRERKVR